MTTPLKKSNKTQAADEGKTWDERTKRSFYRIFSGRFSHMRKSTKFAWFIFLKGYEAGQSRAAEDSKGKT